MKEELTREVLEAMKTCDGACFKCVAKEVCEKNQSIGIRQALATALLEEMDKPKVWEGAPDDATQAQITWFTEYGGYIGMKTCTREPPKTRARQIAENIVHGINGVNHSEEKDVEYVEAVLNKYAEELEGKK